MEVVEEERDIRFDFMMAVYWLIIFCFCVFVVVKKRKWVPREWKLFVSNA